MMIIQVQLLCSSCGFYSAKVMSNLFIAKLFLNWR